jgi:hypothetical protein
MLRIYATISACSPGSNKTLGIERCEVLRAAVSALDVMPGADATI